MIVHPIENKCCVSAHYGDFAKDYRWRMGICEGWENILPLVLEREGRCCRICGSKRELTIHHLTYDKSKQYDLSNYVALCKRCHSEQEGSGHRILQIGCSH